MDKIAQSYLSQSSVGTKANLKVVNTRDLKVAKEKGSISSTADVLQRGRDPSQGRQHLNTVLKNGC